MAKSYVALNKHLKAAKCVTCAISLNSNMVEYFQLRCSIYEVMGFKELAEDDKNQALMMSKSKFY